MRGMRAGVVVLAAVVAAACGRGDRVVTVDPGEGAPQELAASLDAKVRGDTVVFTLHVSNPTPSAVRLTFPSGQRFDFTVGSLSGEVLWTWSAARSFMQSVGEMTLGPGESTDFEAAWESAKPGEYSVTGVVTSSDKPVELRTLFEVPSR